MANCDAESDVTIIQTRSCTVKIDKTLRVSPFNLHDLDSVYAIVSAINSIGSSIASDESNGVSIPIAELLEPEEFKFTPLVPTCSIEPLDSYLLLEGDYEESNFQNIVF